MGSGQHAYFAPSSAPVWGNCSGSVIAAQATPQGDTEDTLDGNAAHWVGSEVLEAWKGDGVPLTASWEGQTAPNGVVIDSEMVESAEIYVNDIMQVVQRVGGLRSLLVEHRVAMPRIDPDNWGTLDAGLHVPERKVIYLWDFKFGHKLVGALENLQLIDYLSGLVAEFGIDGAQEQDYTVVFRIVQPRCYQSDGPIDEWVVNLSELRAYVNRLAAQCNEARTNPTCHAGKWCEYCPAIGRCGTAKAACYSIIDAVGAPYAIDTMSGAELAAERQILETGKTLLLARLEAIEDDLHHRIQKGETGTGLVLQSNYGRRNWTAPFAQVMAAGKMFGLDVQAQKPITPTQAKAMAPAAIQDAFAQTVDTMSTRKLTGLTLTPAEGSRTHRVFNSSNKPEI